MKLKKLLFEVLNKELLARMRDFGISSSDVDVDGYITVYHGGKQLPKTLRPNEIFYMTPNEDEARDYANMRQGEVFPIRIKPEDVNWNVGSREIEFDKGGSIRNGVLVVKAEKQSVNGLPHYSDKWETKGTVRNVSDYKKFKMGSRLPKTRRVIKNIFQHKNGFVQIETDDGQYFNADTLHKYEYEE